MPKLKIISSSSIAAIAAITMASGAFAADLAEPAPIEPIDVWTGFHVGVGGGGAYNFFKTNLDHAYSESWCLDGCGIGGNNGASGVSTDYSGVAAHLGRASAFGTVELGYDWQFNDSFVLGVLGSFDFGKGKWAKAGSYAGESYDATYFDGLDVGVATGMKVRRKNSWFVGGRLGWATSPSTLWYGVLGYTQAKLQARGAVAIDGFEGDYFFDGNEHNIGGSKKRGGFTIGGGAETMLTESVSAKLEYRYTNFKKWKRANEFSGDFGNSRDSGLDWDWDYVQAARVKMSEHSVRAVISYRFNNLFQ
jgi:outer membrane immunogenic protein